ncbi:MAG: hypothetical protein IKI57_01435 [Clostridia bacterium]|nr:hypothetical protein [Clostridia bacterium]
METDTVKRGRLKYFVRKTGIKCNSSIQATHWLDCFNDVSARIYVEEEDKDYTVGPLASISSTKEIVTLLTVSGEKYEISKIPSKNRRIGIPTFIVYSDKKEDVEEGRTKDLFEAKKFIDAKRKVRAFYDDGYGVKAYSGFIDEIDIVAKTFKTKNKLTYFFK